MTSTEIDEAITEIDAQILAAAAGPSSVTVDGMTTQQRPLADLIAYRKHLASLRGAGNSRRGLRYTKLVPPGTD